MHVLLSFPDLVNVLPPFAFHCLVLDLVRAGGQAFVAPA
jgi:hypothetical protein